MVARRDERIARFALGSANPGGRLKSGDDAPQLVETIAVADIDPDPDQPRRHFDALKLRELADSLRTVGQLQPIILIRRSERYQVYVGERRWRAARLAGLPTVRAIVRASSPEARMVRIAQIVENEQRDDLTTTELIEAVRGLHADGIRSVEIAALLSKPKSRISELSALGEAPPQLLAIADAIGLSLSYQLFRQWRADPQAALDFVTHMPVEHISRVTIATIGQSPIAPVAIAGGAGAPATTSANGEPASVGADKGATPRSPDETSRPDPEDASGSRRPPSAPRPQARSTIGTLLVEHAEHGLGSVVFGADVPADHLAVSFDDAEPIVLHKTDFRLVRTLPSRG